MSKLRKNDYFTIQWDQVIEDAEIELKELIEFNKSAKGIAIAALFMSPKEDQDASVQMAKIGLDWAKKLKVERGGTVYQVRATLNRRGISTVTYDIDEHSCTGIEQKYCQKVYKRDLTPAK
jgi:hypothetical protein